MPGTLLRPSQVLCLCHLQESREVAKWGLEAGHSDFRACDSENPDAKALQRFGEM